MYFFEYDFSIGCKAQRIIKAIIVVAAAAKYNPPPVASPIAATVHRPAAVVNPRMAPRFKNNMVPAPIKPIPLTTCAATLEGSSDTCSVPKISANPKAETIIIKQEPTLTIMWVLKPAAQSFLSRSKPINAPNRAARDKRINISLQLIILIVNP